jgi:hypothetical protein
MYGASIVRVDMTEFAPNLGLHYTNIKRPTRDNSRRKWEGIRV